MDGLDALTLDCDYDTSVTVQEAPYRSDKLNVNKIGGNDEK